MILRLNEFYRKRRFGPDVVNRGAILLECDWAGGRFESGTMLGGIFRGGEVIDGTFSGVAFIGGAWRGGRWLCGYDGQGRYRPRTDHPPFTDAAPR
jgi:hypothetical protein